MSLEETQHGGENMQTKQRPVARFKPQPWRYEAAVLIHKTWCLIKIYTAGTYCKQVHDGMSRLSEDRFTEPHTDQRTRIHWQDKKKKGHDKKG